MFSNVIVGTKWMVKHLQGPKCQFRLYVHGWKRHMIESVPGYGQLYVFLYRLALKLQSTAVWDKRTVSQRDGSAWPLLGGTYWHRLYPQWWTALSFGLFISWPVGASEKSVLDSNINRQLNRKGFSTQSNTISLDFKRHSWSCWLSNGLNVIKQMFCLLNHIPF